MGHSRLGPIPKSKKWTSVVNEVIKPNSAKSGNIFLMPAQLDEIAKKTLEAAEGGLKSAINDVGLQYSYFLLTQITLASRQEDWVGKLNKLGIIITEQTTAYDFGSQIQSNIDNYIIENGRTTDISEIAQKSIGDSFSSLISSEIQSLFQSNKYELRLALKRLSTKEGFSELGQTFFGSFMTHYLNFYLSRITNSYIENKNIKQIGNITEFNRQLAIHCKQSAKIVRGFCGEWYSKTEYLEGINQNNSSRFVAVALKKLQSEIKQQRME